MNRVNIGDDFYNHVNYVWLQKTEIPDDFSNWCTFIILREKNKKRVSKIIDKSKYILNSNFNKIGIFHCQYLSNKNFEKMNEIISNIKSIHTTDQLFTTMINYDISMNISQPLNYSVDSDFSNSTLNILHIDSGGLGLPDRDYYFLDSKKEIRDNYLIFIKNYSKLFGLTLDENAIFELEKNIANKTFTQVQKRDTLLLNNPISYEKFIIKYPNLKFIIKLFDYAKVIPGKINITNITYIDHINDIITSVSLDTWKQYFCFKLILGFYYCFNEEVEITYFNFYGKLIGGVKKIKTIEERAVEITNNYFGELIGQIYAKKYFNPKSKDYVNEMVELLKLALCEHLNNNDWMSQQTKYKAIEKLDKMNVKIGYPDKYDKNYDNLEILETNSFMQNIINIISFESFNNLKDLYKQVNKNKWYMHPHTVNAYYAPNNNEIVFPAGILQKPFFSIKQSDAYNFGGIGMIIGHEITHGFDDQGCLYDGDGNLKEWWTNEDKEKYKLKTNIIKEQYNNYMIEGNSVNGELTLGENIADIGGITLSFKAMGNFLKTRVSKKSNQYTNEQLFFINFSNIWKSKANKEDVLQKLLVDPHSPPEFRVNGTLRNIDAFYKAFNITKYDKLYLPPSKRAYIWN